jgi:hypothetical protein
MARRAQSSVSPVVLLIGLALLAGAAVGGYFFLGKGSTPAYPPLNIEDFRKNSLSQRGNTYYLEGTVDRRDRVTAQGQIITLLPGPDGKEPPIPVLLPAGLKGDNIESGYRLRAVVEINQDGLPEARSIVK